MKKLATPAIFFKSPPLFGQILQSSNVSLRNLFVHFLGEQQSHVDIDAFADQLPNRRQSFRRARNFDHHVLAIHRFPQATAFVDGFLRLQRQHRRDFQADVTIAKLRVFIHRVQNVGGVLNVADWNLLVPRGRVEIGLRGQRFNMSSYSELSPIAFSKSTDSKSCRVGHPARSSPLASRW